MIVSRRFRHIATTALAGIMLLAAACAPIQEKAQPAPKSSGPKRGGKLTLVQTGDIDPNPSPLGVAKYSVLLNIYSTLTRADKNGNPQPELAESWTWNADKTELTLKLRKGVKFHDGREFTADDVIYNIQRVQKPEIKSQLLSMTRIMSPAKVDDSTVRIKFSAPPNTAFDAFDQMVIVDRNQSEGDLSRKPNGTGPFKLAELVPGQHVRLVRNANFWKPDLPYLDEVRIEIRNDAPAMVVNLEAGAVDVVRQPPNNELERLRKAGKTVQISENVSNTYDYVFNTSKPPFETQEVRQAINYAIDRKRMVETVLFGVGKVICTPWPATSWAYSERAAQSCAYDLEKAKKLLTEAGYPNGFETMMYVSSANFPAHTQMAQILQADLAKIGVRLKVQDLETSQWVDMVNGAKFDQMAAHLFGFANKDPGLLFTARPFVPDTGITRYKGEEYKRLVNEGAATADQARRKPVYGRLAEIMADEAFIVPISPQYRLWAMQPYVKGLTSNLDDMEIYESVWLDK